MTVYMSHHICINKLRLYIYLMVIDENELRIKGNQIFITK